jgi:CRISPR-associated protein Csd1
MQRLQNNRTGFLINRQKELDEIINAFKPEEFINDKKLSGEFLLGYHCQRQNSYNKTEAETSENT